MHKKLLVQKFEWGISSKVMLKWHIPLEKKIISDRIEPCSFFGFDYTHAFRYSSSDLRKCASCSSWVAGNVVFCHDAV